MVAGIAKGADPELASKVYLAIGVEDGIAGYGGAADGFLG